jgi:threonine aldolase
MVIFGHTDAVRLLAHLGDEGILAGTIAPGVVRLVTHHDVDDEGVERVCKALAAAPV